MENDNVNLRIMNNRSTPRMTQLSERRSSARLDRLSLVKIFERSLEDQSAKIFENLCIINENQKNINLQFLRNLICLYSKETRMDEPVKRIISTYKMIESIKNGKFKNEAYYDSILSMEEFRNLITGKNIKSLLFQEQSVEYKRFYTEEFYKVRFLLNEIK